jgi:hypothetical protein
MFSFAAPALTGSMQLKREARLKRRGAENAEERREETRNLSLRLSAFTAFSALIRLFPTGMVTA